MLTTRFTKLVGCTVPIQQAGMGAAAPPDWRQRCPKPARSACWERHAAA